MNLSLPDVAFITKGKLHSGYVTLPGPEASSKRGWKARRHTVTIWLQETPNGQRLGVNGHHSSHTNKMEFAALGRGLVRDYLETAAKEDDSP